MRQVTYKSKNLCWFIYNLTIFLIALDATSEEEKLARGKAFWSCFPRGKLTPESFSSGTTLRGSEQQEGEGEGKSGKVMCLLTLWCCWRPGLLTHLPHRGMRGWVDECEIERWRLRDLEVYQPIFIWLRWTISGWALRVEHVFLWSGKSFSAGTGLWRVGAKELSWVFHIVERKKAQNCPFYRDWPLTARMNNSVMILW